jgi:hypothetical protein
MKEMEVLVLVVDNINERYLCLLIYKAGARLFPKYRELFNDDIEEFQQVCAVLMLKHIHKHDTSKGAISTFIYNSLPLLVRRWCISKEAKTMRTENLKTSIDILYPYTDFEDCEKFEHIFISDEDLVAEQIKEETRAKVSKIIEHYPLIKNKIYNDLTFPQLARKLKMTERQIKYRYALEMVDLMEKYENILKSLYYL